MADDEYSVSIQRGVVVRCDPTIKTYIQHLNSTKALGREFILQDLGAVGVLVEKEFEPRIRKEVTTMLDSNEFQDKDKDGDKRQ